MNINPNIFKSYDIRGAFPNEINTDVAYFIGRAYVKFINRKNLKIVVGRDNRLSSKKMSNALIKGITDQGADVIDIGLSPTPVLYFAVSLLKSNGGINVTASHLPAGHSGLKLVRGKAIPISGNSGLKDIKDILIKNKGKFSSRIKKGKIIRKQVLKEYIEFNFKDFNLEKTKSMKIVIDVANAVPGILLPYLKKELPCKIYPLFEKSDGSFPNHSPDPLIKKNLRDLIKVVKNKKADFGVALDGDGDRIVFVDEKGKIISGDLLTAFLSEFILKDNPGVKILYDVRSSRSVKKIIEKNQGKPIVWKVGHSLIKEKMRKENIFFAGELSGHYYKMSHHFSEVPVFVLLKILEILSLDKERKLSKLIGSIDKYFHSGEINFKIENKEEIMKKLERKFSKGKISKIDGLRIDFQDWWFLVRPSNTENLLRMMVETDTKELLDEKKRELTKLITDL
ncbi:MAG: phosphomannomutase/phosphoglucomutase [Patescibacteria group bacterium]|nr:phosphomannomutase/phosphoglucomutase [Patescibacteria group bacterium]